MEQQNTASVLINGLKTVAETPAEIRFDEGRICFCIDDKTNLVKQKLENEVIKTIVNFITHPALERDFIDLSTRTKVLHVRYESIIYIKAEEGYLVIYLTDNSTEVSFSTLEWMMERLPPADFMRVHSGHIVSRKHISKVTKCRPMMLTMCNGERLNVSESNRKRFLDEWFN